MTFKYDQEETIASGDEFLLSKIGHKGFYYPDKNNIVTLSEDMIVKRISWTCGSGDYSAYTVEASKIEMFSPPVNVIWIYKEVICLTKT